MWITKFNMALGLIVKDYVTPRKKEGFLLYINLCWTSGGAQLLNLEKKKKIFQKGKGPNPAGCLAGLPWSF